MCLEKKERSWITAGWVAIMIAVMGTFASDIRRNAIVDTRLTFVEAQANKGDRFTQEDAKLLRFQIDSILKMVAEIGVTHDKFNDTITRLDHKLDDMKVEAKTHNHGTFSKP